MIHDHTSFAAARRASAAYRPDAAARIQRFVPMVRRLAWHAHGGGRPGIDLEDLMQAGMVALTEAAQRHAGPGEDGFAAYAKVRVRGAMVDLIRRHVPLSRGAVERRRHLREHELALRGKLGRDPTAAELSAALGVGARELAALQSASEPLRFEPIDTAYSDNNPDFADDRPDALQLLADEELRGSLIEAIAALPERLQLVVQLYFVEELNLTEIAAALQVSVPRVHQLKAQALEKLRHSLADLAEVL